MYVSVKGNQLENQWHHNFVSSRDFKHALNNFNTTGIKIQKSDFQYANPMPSFILSPHHNLHTKMVQTSNASQKILALCFPKANGIQKLFISGYKMNGIFSSIIAVRMEDMLNAIL